MPKVKKRGYNSLLLAFILFGSTSNQGQESNGTININGTSTFKLTSTTIPSAAFEKVTRINLDSSQNQQDQHSELTSLPCEEPDDCKRIESSYCDIEANLCRCKPDYPVTDTRHCYKESKYDEFCQMDIQCQRKDKNTKCNRDFNVCECQPRYIARQFNRGQTNICVENNVMTDMSVGSYVNPTLFGIMGGLALMFIVMCVVLRLFAKAQFTENRTIFNTPNPRLMNVSLLKESKLLDSERKGRFVPRSTRRISSSVLMAAAAAAAAHLGEEVPILEEPKNHERGTAAGSNSIEETVVREPKKRTGTGTTRTSSGSGRQAAEVAVGPAPTAVAEVDDEQSLIEVKSSNA